MLLDQLLTDKITNFERLFYIEKFIFGSINPSQDMLLIGSNIQGKSLSPFSNFYIFFSQNHQNRPKSLNVPLGIFQEIRFSTFSASKKLFRP
jgi:hypothetical protein